MENIIDRINAASSYIAERIGNRKPLAGIVLGSGLGKLGESIEDPVIIPYKEIPGFPVSTAVGHKGNMICGTVGGKIILAMQGRFHYYEGYPMELVTIGIRTMARLGIKFLFVSNAAGAANQDYNVGDIVLIKDHINMFPNPLVGRNLEEFGPRFPDMTCAYDLELQERALKFASEIGFSMVRGVYLGSTGPTYETPAEVRFYHTIGADLLGMSTIPEVIVARHCGIRVLGTSVVTNICNQNNIEKNLNDADDVVRQADMAASRLCSLFTKILESL